MAATATIKLPFPHPGQRAVRAGAARHNWLAAGRRWRKTTLFMALAVEKSLQGRVTVWGAPTFDQVRVGFEEMRKAAGGAVNFNQSRMTAEFPGGGLVLFRSLDNPDNARGHTADQVIIDEAADVSPVAWYEVLRPMLIDTNGESWAGGTPKGRNWFWNEFVHAQSDAQSAAWCAPTLGVRISEDGSTLLREPHALENPHIPFEEMQRLFATMPERTFRQEILAEFVEGEGAVFRKVRDAATVEAAHPGRYPLEAGRTNGGKYVMGVDWAQSRDYTVIAVIERDTRQLVALDRFNQIDWTLQRGRLAVLANRWKPEVIWAEENSIGGPNVEELRRAGLPVRGFQTTASSKPPLIESLVLAFEKGEIAIMQDEILIGELEGYERTVSPVTGRPRYGAPEGAHDDCVIALALAWHGVTHTGQITMHEENPFF